MSSWRDLVNSGVIVCPADRGALLVKETELECADCDRRYRIDDDIPVLLLSDVISPSAHTD